MVALIERPNFFNPTARHVSSMPSHRRCGSTQRRIHTPCGVVAQVVACRRCRRVSKPRAADEVACKLQLKRVLGGRNPPLVGKMLFKFRVHIRDGGHTVHKLSPHAYAMATRVEVSVRTFVRRLYVLTRTVGAESTVHTTYPFAGSAATPVSPTVFPESGSRNRARSLPRPHTLTTTPPLDGRRTPRPCPPRTSQ